MNKEDILTIKSLLDTLKIGDNEKYEKYKKLFQKIDLIVDQINIQDKIQEIENKLMELNKSKEEK